MPGLPSSADSRACLLAPRARCWEDLEVLAAVSHSTDPGSFQTERGACMFTPGLQPRCCTRVALGLDFHLCVCCPAGSQVCEASCGVSRRTRGPVSRPVPGGYGRAIALPGKKEGRW